MPLIARGGGVDQVTTNEAPCSVTTTTVGMSETVFIEGTGVHCLGDDNDTHSYPCGSNCCSHSTNVLTASETVFADKKGVARDGDPYACLAVVGPVLQSTVFADG